MLRPFSRGKIFLLVLGTLLLLLVGFFARSVWGYLDDVRQGRDPFFEQRMERSLQFVFQQPPLTATQRTLLDRVWAPRTGATKPQLTIVEFLDYDCPFSREAFPIVRELTEKYKDRVRLIIRHYPVVDLYPRAVSSALSALCAADQNVYWSYHDKLFSEQTKHEDADYLRFIQATGGNEKTFQTCNDNRKFAQQVEQDYQDGLQLEVKGTPTFFFNGLRVAGVLDRDMLEYLIKRFLAQADALKN